MPQIWHNPWYGRGGKRLVQDGVPKWVAIRGWVGKVVGGRQPVLPEEFEWLGS